MNNKPLDFVVVGGSLAGLMHGIAIKRLGHNVHILEKNPSSLRDGEAAGISAGPQVQEFLRNHDLCKQQYSLLSPGIQYTDKDMNVKHFRKFSLQMTSWNVLYYRLRANFDAFPSAYCRNPPEMAESEGKAVYDLGKRVTEVLYKDGLFTLHFEDLIHGSAGSLQADRVIAADGSNSRIRKLVAPHAKRTYAGYVAWRGLVAEKDISDESRKVFDGKTTLTIMDRNYIVLYFMPGENGSLEPGERMVNFCWYYNLPANSQDFADAMTDIYGHRHRNTLPMGKLSEAAWAKQRAYGNKVLAPPLVELLNKITQPFLTAVSDTIAPQASFFDGKLLLVGDALALFRPHIAASTNQAALNCLLLEKVLKGEMEISSWESQVMKYARSNWLRSITWGTYYQSGYPSYLLSEMWYRLELARQRRSKM